MSAVDRMVAVTAFALVSYANIIHRSRKPMNPMLGETFSIDRCVEGVQTRASLASWNEPEGWRYIAEKVVHHPDIFACYAHGRSGWIWEQVHARSRVSDMRHRHSNHRATIDNHCAV
jgi:hypothetical protein